MRISPLKFFEELPFQRAIGTTSTPKKLISHALLLFAGRDVSASADLEIVSALSEGGLCAYLDTLRDLSLDNEMVGRVHILLRRIERDEKPFARVQDMDDSAENPDLLKLPPEDSLKFYEISRPRLVVRETVRTLHVQ